MSGGVAFGEVAALSLAEAWDEFTDALANRERERATVALEAWWRLLEQSDG